MDWLIGLQSWYGVEVSAMSRGNWKKSERGGALLVRVSVMGSGDYDGALMLPMLMLTLMLTLMLVVILMTSRCS